MFKDRKNTLIFIAVIFLIIGGILFYLLGVNKVSESPSETAEYSYENIVYNFWGFVKEKQGNIISVEGVIPDSAKDPQAEESSLIIKFKLTADTKIIKLGTESDASQPVFVETEEIKVGDHLAIRADQISAAKKEVAATDVLILPPVPEIPESVDETNLSLPEVQ